MKDLFPRQSETPTAARQSGHVLAAWSHCHFWPVDVLVTDVKLPNSIVKWFKHKGVQVDYARVQSELVPEVTSS